MTTYRFVFSVAAETQREKFIEDNTPYYSSRSVTFSSEKMTPAERSWVSALWLDGANEYLFLDGKSPGVYEERKFEQFYTYEPTLKEILTRWIKTNDKKPEYLEKVGVPDEWWNANGHFYRTSLMISIVLGVPFTFDIHK